MNKKLKGSVSSIFLGAFMLSMIFFVGCTNEPDTPGTNEVWLESSAFNPATMTITQGTTVTWTNKDSYDHTVTSGTPTNIDSVFDSGTLGPDETFSFRFDNIGTFPYFCQLHAGMTGTITVQAPTNGGGY